MELRKLCCHVYMLEGVEPETEPSNADEGLRQLLDSSVKMQLLDKMMVKLKLQGHRVLIYSQFQHMLDLLEDYLSFKKWNYERIDGRIGGAERQIRIDRFNAKNSTRFCFLLSTRAGGLGINLATADTVIIYDSDWNPHADLQAMARAHRLGQTNKEELDDIIRYGSKELFAEESDEAGKSRQIHYDDAAIDRLSLQNFDFNRDEIGADETSMDDEDDDLLKAFKVANFEYIDEIEAAAAATRAEEAKKQSMAAYGSTNNPDKANYWDELLRDRYEVIQIEESTAMGKGKRNRKQMLAAGEDEQAGSSSEDEDYSFEDELSDTDGGSAGQATAKKGQLSRKRSRVDLTETHPLMEGEGRSFRVRGFNQNQRAAFLQLLMRFGFGKYDWKEFVPRLKGKSLQEVYDYGRTFMEHLIEEVNNLQTFSDGVPKEGVRIDEVLIRIGIIQSMEEKVKFQSENPNAPLFAEDIKSWFPGMKGRLWKEEHDVLLLKAILKHGYARWQSIVEDKDLGIAEIVRQELNLPVISGPFNGGNHTTNGANSGPLANGSSEATRANQSNPDYSMLYQFREVQKRIVDFIRKRYHILEKAMNTELLKEKTCGGKASEASQDPDIDPKATEILGAEPAESYSSSKELPALEPIALQEHFCDGKDGRVEMISLYNGICRTVEDNTPDALLAYLGNSFASCRLRNNLHELETICEDMCRILAANDPNCAVEDGSGVASTRRNEVRNGSLPNTSGSDSHPPANSAIAEGNVNTHEKDDNRQNGFSGVVILDD
ncbi:hypothetical protein HPP92_004174 [Vanilla planifolia]|uniref:Helicase C-terminal domain-containing protein n=1 Tax=Vanilla planifolia TaxID=51239 RepID=A0A835SH05_VANPL|nr:hypothetical protein HPP92_004174 [Vanilla planifolia]